MERGEKKRERRLREGRERGDEIASGGEGILKRGRNEGRHMITQAHTFYKCPVSGCCCQTSMADVHFGHHFP